MTTSTTRITDDKKINLLHVSPFNSEPVKTVIPRASKTPKSKVPHICAYSDLQGFITANPALIDYLESNTDQSADPNQELYRKQVLLEHNKSGVLFRVYHLEADAFSVIDSNTVYEVYKISDAIKTGEQWITEPCNPKFVTFLLIEGIEFVPEFNEWRLKSTRYGNENDLGEVMTYSTFEYVSQQVPYLNKWIGDGFSKNGVTEFLNLSKLLLSGREAYLSYKKEI